MVKSRTKFGRTAKVALAALLIFGVLVTVWIVTAPYRLAYPRPLPPGSPVSILIMTNYVNDTGLMRATNNVPGLNTTLLDTDSGSTFSVLTLPTSRIINVNLLVGHNYHATATIDSSSGSADSIVGGYGGILEIFVWDNRTVRSVSFEMLTP